METFQILRLTDIMNDETTGYYKLTIVVSQNIFHIYEYLKEVHRSSQSYHIEGKGTSDSIPL